MDQRLKILLSAYACEPGKGSEPEVGWQWVLQMARFHDVTVLTRANNQPVIEPELARLNLPSKPRFIYHDLPSAIRLKGRVLPARGYYMLWQRSARKIVAEETRRQRFDLLHHLTFASFRYTTAIWGHGVPAIWGPIGGIESIPAPLLPWRYPGPLLAEVIRNADNSGLSPARNLLRFRARRSDLVLASTLQMQQALAASGIASQVMPAIGLHTSSFPAAPRAPHRDALRLLYVGNLLPLKGIDLAIEALAASGTNASLTLIGSGPFKPRLESLASRLSLNSRVTFRGRLPREQTLAAYADYDALLFPSLHDTGGYAVIEAMCSGMPVICLATGGPDTAVREGCGIRVPLGSRAAVIGGLAEAIRGYDRDRGRILEDGGRARRAVESHYEWDEKGRQMDAHYRQVTRAS